jgi:hypothetical protein
VWKSERGKVYKKERAFLEGVAFRWGGGVRYSSDRPAARASPHLISVSFSQLGREVGGGGGGGGGEGVRPKKFISSLWDTFELDPWKVLYKTLQ